MKKSDTTLAMFAAIVLVIFGVGAAMIVTAQSGQSPQPASSPAAAPIDTPDRHRTTINYTAQAGVTALQQLQNEADSVVIKNSDYGKYVHAIEGHDGGTDGKYWSFYINGELSKIGPDAYTQQGGENIEWKFQKL